MELEFKDIKYDYGKFKVNTNKLYTKQELDTLLNDRYTKDQTYSKTELNNLIAAPNENHVTVPTYASLPATGSANTVYRVSNYNGSTSQVDASVYSEYAWEGNDYVLLRISDSTSEVFDISVYKNNTAFANLSEALGIDGVNVPVEARQPGMSIKFIQSPNNKYVQHRYIGTEIIGTPNPFLDTDNWQGVDDEPIENSQNLVKSGGVHTAIQKVLQEVEDNSFFVCDENGNVVFTIDDNGISKCVQSQNKQSNDIVVHKDLEFSSFQQNITVNYYWDEDTSTRYSIVRIYKNRTDGGIQIPLLDCIAPQGNPQYSAKELAIAKGYHFVMNCAIFSIDSHGEPDGVLIVNGQIINNSIPIEDGDIYILTIDANGDLGFAAPATDANTLLQNGIVSAFCGFAPLVVDYLETPHPESYAGDGDHYNTPAMRQVIGQYENGDYAVITCEGRDNENSVGWTIPETAQICIKHGLKFAYNCDGGRSTQTVIGKKQINKDYGRKVGTYICFSGTNSY